MAAAAAVELGFSHLSVGSDRFADPEATHEHHLDTVIDALPALHVEIA